MLSPIFVESNYYSVRFALGFNLVCLIVIRMIEARKLFSLATLKWNRLQTAVRNYNIKLNAV